jgi:hydrogenase maturation protease
VSTLLLGVGNPLMGDDGVGLAALERLRQEWRFDPPVELTDGGTWGMSLMPAIEAADNLIIIDAVRAAAVPGTVVELEREQLPRVLCQKLSPHQIDLREVFALCELRGTLPARAVAIGVEPGRVELSDDLSPAVRAAMGALIERILDRLQAWGHDARPAGSVIHA